MVWRRELAVLIRVFAVQGLALARGGRVGAIHGGRRRARRCGRRILVLRAESCRGCCDAALAAVGPASRETRPLVNVAASLMVAALLTLLAYAVSGHWSALPTAATSAIPIGVAIVLIGFFVLVTRRRRRPNCRFLLMDNGITAVGLLTTAGVG